MTASLFGLLAPDDEVGLFPHIPRHTCTHPHSALWLIFARQENTNPAGEKRLSLPPGAGASTSYAGKLLAVQGARSSYVTDPQTSTAEFEAFGSAFDKEFELVWKEEVLRLSRTSPSLCPS